jgi:hypothetical protein
VKIRAIDRDMATALCECVGIQATFSPVPDAFAGVELVAGLETITAPNRGKMRQRIAASGADSLRIIRFGWLPEWKRQATKD